jgi:segregation and condensation protein B
MPPLVMRLVRDDEPMSLIEDPEKAVPADSAPKRRRRGIATDPLQDAPGQPEVAEPSDGAVEQSAADDDASDESAPDIAIDLSKLEALLFSTHHPLTAGRLAELLDVPATKPIRRALRELNQGYESTGRAFRVEQVAGGYQLLTLPEHGDLLRKLHQREIDAKLTKAALETLAIIAYKQPILRADVEAIRGVACGETIRSLMEKHLVKIAGRAEVPGRPILYGTTKRFLELFGLNSLKDLPQPEDPSQKPSL